MSIKGKMLITLVYFQLEACNMLIWLSEELGEEDSSPGLGRT